MMSCTSRRLAVFWRKEVETINKKRAVFLLLFLAFFISAPLNVLGTVPAQQKSKSFPEECFKDSIHKVLMMDGRILVLKADTNNKAIIQCYSKDAVLLWESSWNEAVVPPSTAALLGCPNSTERFALLSRPSDSLCNITIFDSNGNAIHSKEINNCIQMPITLDAGIFYVLRQDNTYYAFRMNWNGTSQPVNIEKYTAISMVWWESCDLDEDYMLVLNLRDQKDVKRKALGFFTSDNQMQWLYVLKGNFNRFSIPAIAKDGNNCFLVWLDEIGGSFNQPILLCIDRQGKVVWQKKIETDLPYLSAQVIKPSVRGGFTLWGNTGTDRMCFELVIDNNGKYVSHEFRQADSLKKYIDGNPYAEIKEPENHRTIFLNFSELKKLMIDSPIRLKSISNE